MLYFYRTDAGYRRYIKTVRPGQRRGLRAGREASRRSGDHPDGSYTARGRLTSHCGALLLATLTPRSAPQANADTGPDPHSQPQRLHDALQDLAGIVVRRNELPESGAPAQVIITMTADQFARRHGLAETSFRQQLSVPEALALADEAAISLLLADSTGAVLAHGRAKRIATRSQALALIGRGGGCIFPGCGKSPEWYQRHHNIAWPTAAGPTSTISQVRTASS